MKKILIILDGAADLHNKILHNKTPLEAAHTPNLDFLAKYGHLGLMYPLKKGITPSSDNAIISILGNDPNTCRRGIYEAIGSNIELKSGDLAIRTNFGTIENLKTKKVIDRRAGRTLTTKEAHILADSINNNIKLSCNFIFKPTVQHRGVLVLRGKHSDNITNIDSEWTSPGKKSNHFKFSEPLDQKLNTKNTSNILNKFIHQSHNILNNHPTNKVRTRKGLYPANMIFTRGAGSKKQKLKQYQNWMATNSMPLEVGIAKLSKMKNFPYKIPELNSIDIYAHLHKLLNLKINHTIKTIKKYHKDFIGCYVHIKETDIPGHDNKPHEKKKMIETLDKKLFSFIKKMTLKNGWKVIVTCDHSTPCELKGHSNHPVPVLVYNPYDIEKPDHAHRFTEIEARMGSLKTFLGKDFVDKVELNK
jgi:2,3-bisphosphoglycerate-independent phosphoglycerate mutase